MSHFRLDLALEIDPSPSYTLVFQNHNFCKIRPNFSPIMHFLQESYEFVQKSQILQVCYSVEHFLQESDNIFAKFVSICKKFLQKSDVLFRPKIR